MRQKEFAFRRLLLPQSEGVTGYDFVPPVVNGLDCWKELTNWCRGLPGFEHLTCQPLVPHDLEGLVCEWGIQGLIPNLVEARESYQFYGQTEKLLSQTKL